MTIVLIIQDALQKKMLERERERELPGRLCTGIRR